MLHLVYIVLIGMLIVTSQPKYLSMGHVKWGMTKRQVIQCEHIRHTLPSSEDIITTYDKKSDLNTSYVFDNNKLVKVKYTRVITANSLRGYRKKMNAIKRQLERKYGKPSPSGGAWWWNLRYYDQPGFWYNAFLSGDWMYIYSWKTQKLDITLIMKALPYQETVILKIEYEPRDKDD